MSILIFEQTASKTSIDSVLFNSQGLIVKENHTKFANAYKDARNHILSGKALQHLNKIQNG